MENKFGSRPPLLAKVSVVALDGIAALLSNHVDRVLNSAVENHGNNRCINETEILDSVDLEVGVDDALLDILGQTSSATGAEREIVGVQFRKMGAEGRCQDVGPSSEAAAD
ncbi:hypothetical protein J3459_011977 [Metarhizium acridum]|uniref:uncharacterized protein n=1 Tax=Metarhizium acridum TaxID=92637 RepID=UPI001C6BABC5|nr:hypothetical protein J3458_022120 [Metarhizium acridum]KAG8418849.1 hypothetical protein J3459_011977 [Metarhizium acridum]